MSLESPHNSIHLAIGGFRVPNLADDSPIDGANGDPGARAASSRPSRHPRRRHSPWRSV